MSKPLRFYTDKPLFGLDIGRSSLKIMQLDHTTGKPAIVGYGTVDFDVGALDGGVVVKPEVISDALHDLFENHLVGDVNTRRVAMALPGYRAFTRSIQLPRLGEEELREAVQLEVEQYVPIPLGELYLDYVITSQVDDNSEVFAVAVPKKIVDSYLALATALGLEPVLIEPTMTAGARLFGRDKHSDMPSIIIDFGSLTATISIFDKTIVATSTVPAGGLVFTEAIRNNLGVSPEEAGSIKTRFGLDISKYQKKIEEALEPSLIKIVTEVRRMLRYYEEHYASNSKSGVGQVVTLGGGANMPGLSDYLTNALKVPVRTQEHPWATFAYGHLAVPEEADRLMYATVAGLGLVDPKEVFTP
jgi:type IV pilus assembly protein PilM